MAGGGASSSSKVLVWVFIGVLVFDISVNIATATYLGGKWSAFNLAIGVLYLTVALIRHAISGYFFGLFLQTGIDVGFALISGGCLGYFIKNKLVVDLLVGFGCASLLSTILSLLLQPQSGEVTEVKSEVKSVDEVKSPLDEVKAPLISSS